MLVDPVSSQNQQEAQLATREVTVVVVPSPRTRPLLDEEITSRGARLRVIEGAGIDGNSRAMENLGLDIAEVSIGTYLRARDQGIPIIGLPIFASARNFPHSSFQISVHSTIRDLSDLRGRIVGASQYWTASSIWQRQFLHQMYGLAAQDITWVTFQPERLEGLQIPSDVRHRLESGGRSAAELASSGELDATLTRGAGRTRDRGAQDQAPVLVPAFPDPAAAQRDYYARTGVYPIQHLVVMREELAHDEPAIVAEVCDLFVEAKRLAQAHEAAETSGPPDGPSEFLEDPWPYGISANRKTLDAFVEAAHEQGLTRQLFGVEGLFAGDLSESMR